MEEYEQALNKILSLKKVMSSIDAKLLNTSDVILERNKTDIERLIDSITTDLKEKFNNEIIKDKTVYYMNLSNNLFSDIIHLPNITNVGYESIADIKKKLFIISEEISNLKILDVISGIDNTVVIIGANGSGKSSLVSTLKETSLPNLRVIPAQKYLFFNNDTHLRDHVTIESYQHDLSENYIKLAKTEYTEHVIRRHFTYPFTYLITALVKDYCNITVRRDRNEKEFLDKKPLWIKLEEIWDKLIPNIQFEINPNDREIIAIKNGNKFLLNGLSDGEKCIIFYIGNILIAPINSYIVVDEPETFLNPSIYNRLWDMLIKEREDCQFIFTSHTMDFINSRADCTYLWCKSFRYPDKFDLKILKEDNEFPMSLLTELLGSRKPILFCEGEYGSIDYKIFSKMFLNDYHIKPVGGCKNVINFTRGYNELSKLHGNRAVGIIDLDYMTESEVEKYKNSNIYTAPFNEIEMLLLDENVVMSVLEPFNDKHTLEELVSNFKNEFIDEINKDKTKILLTATKHSLDKKISTTMIQNYKGVQEIVDEVTNLCSKFDPLHLYNYVENDINELIKNRDYKSLLKICNLKGQMTNGLANPLLMKNYENNAIGRIQNSEELQDLLKRTYFSDLITK